MPEATTVGGVVVLVALIVGLYLFYRYRVPKTDDQDAASKFLEDLADKFEEIIVKIVKTLDISKYVSLEEMEADIFRISYDEIWPFVQSQVEKAIANKAISTLVASLITKENVERVVDLVIRRCGVMSIAEGNWDKAIAAGIAREKEFEGEIEKKNREYEKEAERFEHNPNKFEIDEEENNTTLNPPSEEEEDYDSDADSSVEFEGDPEVVEENTTDEDNKDLIDPEGEEY